MTLQAFWDIFDAASDTPDVDDRIRAVMSQLEGMEGEELAGFRDQVRSELLRASTPILYAAGVLLTGRALDTADRWEAFRCLLLLRGRKFFENVVDNPDRFADYEFTQQEKELDFDSQMLLYAPNFAYQEKYGEEADLDDAFPSSQPEDASDPEFSIDIEELPRIFPSFWLKRRAMIPPRESDSPV